jgi:hypothetical protein
MNLRNSILGWLGALFGSPAATTEQEPLSPPNAPVAFTSITVVNKPPANHEVGEGKLYCVFAADKPKRTLFLCPCGCGSVVTLSLQSVHRPHWRLTKTLAGHPTLYPSIWRDTGCLSHFWLRGGRIAWCRDTGRHPDRRYD